MSDEIPDVAGGPGRTAREAHRRWRAAVIQAAPVPFDVPATVSCVEWWLSEAGRQRADLVVFPEAFVGGYPKGSTFGSVVGDRSNAGRAEFSRYWAAAIEVPGPIVDQLGALAAAAGTHLVIGVVEKEAGTLYCTVLFFADSGELLGRRRKLMPTGAERMIWGFGDGSTMRVHDTRLGRLGAVICWENLMPAARMAMYGQGIELYCAPTADGRESHHATMRHIAMEGRCFVLCANQFTRVADYPDDHPTPYGTDRDTVISQGGSAIVGPRGNVLAGPVYGQETLLVAELDMDDIPRSRFDFDPVGHYSRPDVFTLLVDTTPRTPVHFDAPDGELPRAVFGEQP